MFMFEKAFVGGRRYWIWLTFLSCAVAIGVFYYARQLDQGLGTTGLSRDVSWGLYIAQFTFFVGIAASAVMVVLPYYLHDYKQFGRITILGELLAITSVIVCILLIFVDLGQPARVFNILLYPSPRSLMFWDMICLSGYLVLNAIVVRATVSAKREETPVPRWIKPLVVLSIPWAVSIHTVTAFLYSGLPGRSFWHTAILAPRFLASAFASGPALLILLCLLLRKLTGFDAGEQAIRKLAVIVTYALSINVFFVLVETFTVFYSRIPADMEHFKYLYLGLNENRGLAFCMDLSAVLSVAALAILLLQSWRRHAGLLPAACVFVVVSLWIEKGLGLIVGGFVPSPLGAVTQYTPTLPEWCIVFAIWAAGAMLMTVFCKIALAIEAEVHAASPVLQQEQQAAASLSVAQTAP